MNVVILGYGIHGHGEVVVSLFPQLKQMGTKTNNITFIGVLTTCSHIGLVEECSQYFEYMKSNYGLTPKLEHYIFLVDLLGRAGNHDEAHDIL